MKYTVAQLNDVYLPITESWLYNQTINVTKYQSIFIVQRVKNLDLFPFSDVYSTHEFFLYRYADAIHIRLFDSFFPFYYKKLIKKHNVKLLHAHFGPQGFRYLKIKSDLKLPMITTFYGYDISTLSRVKYWQKAYLKLFKNCELFLVEGTHMKNELVKLGCPIEKIKVHHLGVNINQIRFKPRIVNPKSTITILISGTFTEKKGIIYAIEAFATVKSRNQNIRLRILGDGYMRSQIESLVQNLEIADSVELLGYQPYSVFLSELENAHIFLSPSITAENGDTEGGAPVSIIEAQASGIPVISSYHADIPEVVIDGQSALLAPEKDVHILAEHLTYLVDHPEIWPKIGQTGRAHVEKEYNAEIQGRRLESIYKELIEKH